MEHHARGRGAVRGRGSGRGASSAPRGPVRGSPPAFAPSQPSSSSLQGGFKVGGKPAASRGRGAALDGVVAAAVPSPAPRQSPWAKQGSIRLSCQISGLPASATPESVRKAVSSTFSLALFVAYYLKTYFAYAPDTYNHLLQRMAVSFFAQGSGPSSRSSPSGSRPVLCHSLGSPLSQWMDQRLVLTVARSPSR